MRTKKEIITQIIIDRDITLKDLQDREVVHCLEMIQAELGRLILLTEKK